MRRTFLTLLGAAVALALTVPAQAKLPYVKKAQGMGFSQIKDCQSCHVDKMPKKDAKGEPYNDLGKFLNKKKADTKAAEIDLAWIKDYKGK